MVIDVLVGLALLTADLPDAKDAKPVKVTEVASYCEGVVFDYDGNIYISVGGDKAIMKLTPDGKLSKWAETSNPNGHKILADGTHLVCDAPEHAILHLDAAGKRLKPASTECNGKSLLGPNDLTLDPKGGFYFTDPEGTDEKNPVGTVNYVDAESKTHLVAGGIAYPNGIVLRPDGKTLLVAESRHNRVLVYDVVAPGRVGPMKVFANLPPSQNPDAGPDGMCLDDSGNLWIAHWGMRRVVVLNPEGKLLRTYPSGNLATSNVAFGGPHRDQLYVTGSLEGGTSKGALFRLDLKEVRGLEILPKQEKK